MKKCFICKKFDKVSQSMGICTDTGEKVGINNSCRDIVIDVAKRETIIKTATKLYFNTDIKMEEAIEKAIEFHKWEGLN